MDIRITPGLLEGTVTPPPSKSIAHRAILAAALTSETSTIQNITLSQDIEATLRCVSALGGAWKQEGDTLHVSGLWHREWDTAELPHLDCGESGSTLRFMIPIALTLNNGGVFTGRGRLMERPQKPYFDIFDEKGIFYQQKDGVLTIKGELMPGDRAALRPASDGVGERDHSHLQAGVQRVCEHDAGGAEGLWCNGRASVL